MNLKIWMMTMLKVCDINHIDRIDDLIARLKSRSDLSDTEKLLTEKLDELRDDDILKEGKIEKYQEFEKQAKEIICSNSNKENRIQSILLLFKNHLDVGIGK